MTQIDKQSEPTYSLDHRWQWLFVASCVLMAVAFFNTAWVSDDAFITFRAIQNFIEGHGPVWNLGERVQVFTHPLWFLTLSAINLLIDSAYWASLVLSAFCLAGTLWYIRLISGDLRIASLAIVALSLSKVFIDYTSSGLENPLSYLLVCALFFHFHKIIENANQEHAFLTLLAGSLLCLNRFDLFLIVAPVALATLYHIRHLKKSIIASIIVITATPSLAWLIFATYYYGSFLPNTYYAKLSAGIPGSELYAQGLHYLIAFARYDTSSFLILFLGLTVGFIGRQRAFSLGCAFYIIYSLKSGGDFMVGRFYTVPLLVSFLIIMRSPVLARYRKTTLVLLAVASTPSIFATILSPANYSDTAISSAGIANERGFYTFYTGLRQNIGFRKRYYHPFAQNAFAANESNADIIETCYVGLTGYFANADLFIVDAYGLTDPLLARLPALYPWRIGHFERPSPEGYHEVLAGHRNALKDGALETLRQDLYLAHQAPLNESGRTEAIIRLQTSTWKQLITSSPEVNSQAQFGKLSPFHCRGQIQASFHIISRKTN